jgi:nucleoside-diphosphate-sugar epimerase
MTNAAGAKTILVTGGAGYIGSVLVRQLLEAGFHVRVSDILRWGDESITDLRNHSNFEFYQIDIRDKPAMERIISGCRAVAHLAAVVGDPACKADPEGARSINLDASIQLYEIANRNRCERFVFASTCSNYGKMTESDCTVDETSLLSPLSIYAATKVEFEKYLLSLPETSFCKPTCLRFATVYGPSPRMRFDLTVNEFTKELKLGRELVIFGEQFWRPYCHVNDLARAVCLALTCALENVAFDVFNVGDTSENYSKKMLADMLRTQFRDARISYVKKEEDPRDYRVSSDKIRRELGFQITRKVEDGIHEIMAMIDSGLITNPDDRKYYNS